MTAPLVDRPAAAPDLAPVPEATLEEGRAMLDEAARYYLGISGDAFLHRWESGYYAADPDAPGVQNVASLLAFVPQSHAA